MPTVCQKRTGGKGGMEGGREEEEEKEEEEAEEGAESQRLLYLPGDRLWRLRLAIGRWDR